MNHTNMKMRKRKHNLVKILMFLMVISMMLLASACSKKADKESESVNLEQSDDTSPAVTKEAEVENTDDDQEKEEEIEVEDTLIDSAFNRVTVHDPSIIKANGTYYVFGSHVVAAQSEDLVSWKYVKNSNLGYSIANEVYPNPEGMFAEPLVYSEGKGKSGLWAPDVIYNETMGKYCLYMSIAGGPVVKSAIALAVADDIEGPYTYVDTILYTGFTPQNVDQTDVLAVLGETSLPSRYNYDGSSNANWPNGIDATVFYDYEGNLWMVYGSMSGGIYILELDEETGKIDRNVKYPVDKNSDPYLGKRIAGGLKQTGEGPYIMYDKEAGYYYLFSTYGYLTAGSGYHMRLFRSENPDGPYVDAAGNSAIISSGTNAGIGIKLFGDYKFGNMSLPYVSPGHNSAFVDEDGKRFVIYHTRGVDQGNKEGHQIRVHQMFVNEDGWLTVAPYEYAGETLPESGYPSKDVIGEYEIIFHGLSNQSNNVKPETPVLIRLNDDGSISGSVEGTWEKKNGTPYVDFVLNDLIYKGVFIRQYDESAFNSKERNKIMTFTALSNQNDCIWGSMVDMTDELAVSYDAANISLPTRTKVNLDLPLVGGYGSTITWSSSDEAIISSSGEITRSPDEDLKVTLTALLSRGSATEEKTFNITVEKGLVSNTNNPDGIIAHYKFDSGSELEDSSGNGYTLVNHGVTFKDGAAVFDGSSYLEIPSKVIKSEFITILIKFKVDNFNQTNPLLSFGDDPEQCFDITVDTDETITVTLLSKKTDHSQSTVPIPVGEWEKFAFNSGGTDSIDGYKGGSIAAINGQRAWRGKTFGELVGFAVDGSKSYIGMDQLGNYLQGEIDEITIYNYYIGEAGLKIYTE